MSRLLKATWIVPLVGGLLYLVTTTIVLFLAHFEPPVPVTLAKASLNEGPSWSFRNPEFEQWVQELKQERENVAQRAQQLQELQKRLDAERLEILAVTQTVHQLQMDFDQNVVRIKEQQLENLKHQTKIVGAMSPEGAAAMLNEMPEDQSVGVLFMLKPDSASVILDTMSKMGRVQAKRAAELTERIKQVLPPPPSSSRTASSN